MKLRQRFHLFLFICFFFKLCKHRSTSSKININFFFNNLNYYYQKVICRTSRFGRNSVLAEILFAQWRTTLAHMFTSEGKHSGSENAGGYVESCSEGRGEYHACLTREISLYPPSKLSCNRFYYVSNAFTDIFWFLHSFVISKDFFSFISVSNAPIIWQQSLSMAYKMREPALGSPLTFDVWADYCSR